METEKGYNGWTNYETWNVALWIDNEKGSQDHWLEEAAMTLRQALATDYSTLEQNAAILLSEILKSEHEEALPEVRDNFRETPDAPWMMQGFAVDLLNAAMSEVNWYEIAEHLIETAKENTPTE